MIMDTGTWMTAAGALVAVAGLVLLAGHLARRAGFAPSGAGRLRMEAALALDARRRLVIVRCDGRALLLLTGGPQDQVVGWLPETGA